MSCRFCRNCPKTVLCAWPTDMAHRSPGDRLLAGEALIWLGVMRLAIILAPFRYIVRLLGLIQENPRIATSKGVAPVQAGRVGWAVQAAACRTPWESTCLVQALAGAIMLRIRGMSAIITLGVTKDDLHRPDEPLAAHAWLCCRSQTLTGGSDLGCYSVLSRFTSTKDDAPKASS